MNPSNDKIVLSNDFVTARKDRPSPTDILMEKLNIDSVLYHHYLPLLLFPMD